MAGTAIVAVVVVLGVVLLIIAGSWTIARAAPAIHRRRVEKNDYTFFDDCTRPFLNHLLRRLPAPPRCRLCFAPFRGIGPVIGARPSRKNPKYCEGCFERAPMGGHEMAIGVLFADVRGFTALAERQSATEITRLLNRFYSVATDVLVAHDAIIDKLVGDEVMALFLPQFPALGERTCCEMLVAARALLRGVGYGSRQGPWLPLGIGIAYGQAMVGNVGTGEVKDFTALGDVVNTAERLQECAESGQVLISEPVYEAATEACGSATSVALRLKGKEEPVQARMIAMAPRESAR